MVIDITPAPILSKGWGTPTNAALETLAAQAQTADEVASIASSVADAKFAEVSVDLVDATMTATAETPSSDFAQHLNGTYAPRVVAPMNADISAISPAARGNSVPVFTQNNGAWRGGYRSLVNTGDYVEWDVAMAAGKWVLNVETLKADGGTFSVSLDGVQVGTVDTYSTTGTRAARDDLPVVTIRDAGVYRVRLTLTSKHASATTYVSRISGFTLGRVDGAKIPATAELVWEFRDTDFTPHSVGSDGSVYGHTSSRTICKINPDGTLALGRNIGEYTISGEYVIWTTRTTAGYIAVTSSDVAAPGNFGAVYFGATLTGAFAKVQVIKGTNEFAIAQAVGANGQTHLLIGEYSTDMPQPVHLLWLSKDGGQTWATVKTAKNTDTLKNSHFHAPCIDNSRTPVRYWSSQGDNGNSVFAYSDNEGSTWTEVPIPSNHPLYQSDSTNPQPTVVGVFPGGQMFTSPDRQLPAGIWSQASDGVGYPSQKWVTPRGEPSHNMFGRQPFVQSGDVAMVVIPDRFVGNKRLYFIATGDAGLSWHKVYEVDMGTGSASTGVVGPDASGKIYWRSEGFAAPHLSKLLVADLPVFKSP